MKKKAQSKQSKKILTVGELKTWLDGYCSAHDDNWTPTPEQWNMIKEKIFSLDDTVPTQKVPAYVAPVGPIPRQVSPPAPIAPTYSGGTTLPLPPSSLASDGQTPHSGSNALVGVSDRPATIVRDGRLITPNKDTPGGPSDFA